MGGSRGSTIVWAVSLTDVQVLQNTLRTVAAILVNIVSYPTEKMHTVCSNTYPRFPANRSGTVSE